MLISTSCDLSRAEKLICVLQSEDFLHSAHRNVVNNAVYCNYSLSPEKQVSTSKEVFERIMIDDKGACSSKTNFVLKDIKSVLRRQRAHAKHDESLCYRPEQGVQQREVRETLDYLCRLYISHIHQYV